MTDGPTKEVRRSTIKWNIFDGPAGAAGTTRLLNSEKHFNLNVRNAPRRTSHSIIRATSPTFLSRLLHLIRPKNLERCTLSPVSDFERMTDVR